MLHEFPNFVHFRKFTVTRKNRKHFAGTEEYSFCGVAAQHDIVTCMVADERKNVCAYVTRNTRSKGAFIVSQNRIIRITFARLLILITQSSTVQSKATHALYIRV